MHLMAKGMEGILQWLFPPKCLLCNQVLDDGEIDLCPKCHKTAPWIPPETRRTQVQGVPHAAPFVYRDGVRSCVHRLKFGSGGHLALPMGRLMAQCAAAEFAGEFDTVTWAPVSRWRRFFRGYDQGQLLAKAMGKLWGVKPVRALQKVRHNPAQSTLTDPSARQANVLGAYALRKGVDLQGKRILLVDDVCTTGSTLGECVRMLKLAGAESVVCVTFAKTKS